MNKKTMDQISSYPSGWLELTVGEACSIRNDLRKPISNEEREKIHGEFPYYGPTGILGYIKECRMNGEYALIGEDGDHFLKYKEKLQTLLIKGMFNVNNHAHVIESTNLCTANWFYWFFLHKNIRKYLTRQGAARYKLNKDSLQRIPILLPPLPEQQAIVDVLESWNKAIIVTEKLLKAKEKRFLAFTNEYLIKEANTKITFGKIFSSAHLKNNNDSDLEILSVTTRGIVFQSEYFNKDVASVDKSNYLIVERDMLVMSGLNFWMGAIDFQRICDKGLVSPAYKVFRLNNTDVDKTYMAYFVRSHLMTRVLLEASIQGASIVRRNLDMEKLKSTIIKLPSYNEQIQISSLFNEAQKELNILRKTLTLYKKQKQALIQKLLTGEWRVKA